MEITVFKKKVDLMKIKELIISILGIYCLLMTMIYLIDGQNQLYQTLKDIWYAKAFFMFAAFMVVIQRVRFFNWQSLVVSALYWPFGYMYREARGFAPDLFNRDKVVVWIVWLFLMIVVDMFVYKKHTPLEKFNKNGLAVFAAMTTFLIFYRNGRNYPIVLVMAMIFYLIPMGAKKWSHVVNQFCYAHLAAFAVMLYRSLLNNPEVDPYSGRWYGDFLNIGDFGLFLGQVVAVVLYKLYLIKKEKGRKNIEYIFWMISLLPVMWAVFRVSTITCYIGIIFIFLMGFVAIRKEVTIKNALFRLVSVTIGVIVAGIAGFLALKGLANLDIDYWDYMLLEGNVFVKTFANLVHRAHYMFNETRTFAECGIFDPDSIVNYVDLFTSGRLSIIKVFSEYFNFTGNPSTGYYVGEYFAHNTHNTYSQLIFDYGYIGGGLFIIWLLYSMVASVVGYIKEKQHNMVFVCIWMAMLLGILLGESASLYYPIMVMTVLVMYPLIVKVEKKNEEVL